MVSDAGTRTPPPPVRLPNLDPLGKAVFTTQPSLPPPSPRKEWYRPRSPSNRSRR